MSLHTPIFVPEQQDATPANTQARLVSYAEALNMAGDQHTYQIRLGFLIAIGMIIAGLQIMGFPFIFREPEIECQASDGTWVDCTPNEATCKLPMRAKEDTIHSIITTFGSFCDSNRIRIIAETLYMVASALGVAAFAPVADKYGKRVALIVSYSITCLSLIACTFSTEWYIFLVMLIFSGLGRAPFIYYGYQVLVEVSSEFFRSMGVLIMGVTFALGAAATGGLNLIVNYDWKDYYMFFIALPSLLAIPLVYFWADESPMSYFPRYEFNKARKALMKIAKVNKRPLPFFRFEKEKIPSFHEEEEEERDFKQYSIVDLFRYPSLRRAAIGGSYLSFVTYFVFYGQILALDTLTNNPVVVAILTSVVEGLACIASLRFLTKYTRRKTVIISFLITAIAFVLYGFLSMNKRCKPGDEECELIFTYIGYAELSLGRFWIAMLMCTTFVYANELFPTVIRSRGSGLINFCGRIGSVLPSSVIYLCKNLEISPAIIFGILAAPACLLGFFMKETKGKPLEHHIEEEEQLELDKQVEEERKQRRTLLEEDRNNSSSIF